MGLGRIDYSELLSFIFLILLESSPRDKIIQCSIKVGSVLQVNKDWAFSPSDKLLLFIFFESCIGKIQAIIVLDCAFKYLYLTCLASYGQ